MQKQLLTALSVAVFVLGAGSFAYLANDIWSQTHPREIVDITTRPRSSAASSSGVSLDATSSTAATTTTPTMPGTTAKGEMVITLPGWSQGYTDTMPSKVARTITGLATGPKQYTLTGTTVEETKKIVVTYTPAFGDARDSDVYPLKNFSPGETNWRYTFSPSLGNLKPGLNEYVIRAYDAAESVLAERTVVTHYGQRKTESPTTDLTVLDVTWSDPVRANLLDLYAKTGDADRFVHFYGLEKAYLSSFTCMMGGDIIMEETVKTPTQTRQEIAAERVYAVGKVNGGLYAGATVYAHQGLTSYCGGGNSDDPQTTPFHFLQKTDGTLMRLNPYSWSPSVVTEGMPWDERSVVSGNGPDNVRIDNSGVRLVRCEERFCRINGLADPSKEKAVAGFSQADMPVYEGVEGCFQVKRADGFLQDYKVDIKMGDVAWLDGTTSNTVYTGDPVTGGCGQQPHHCHWEYEGDPAELERVGTTVDGLEVYQEKISPAELVAMGSGSAQMKFGPTSLYELYWSMARYDESKIPTPKQFVAAHPAVYVKDPLGRLLYFQGEQYGPAVECGKPVIYLYPEREMDIDVYVAPTGGFTVTDPPYNDGWHVRATPDSDIHNYGNRKNYPYLFWEGHGAEYSRPERGFVFSRAEAPALVREKLALLGLVDNEIDDFMEFWEPRLTVKPYVFVTFVDQPTFDTIAPLTVEPTPDSVIRVFMDYEPLDAPIEVEPLPIVTPKREGFSVVEWGGALHPGDRGMCPADILLQ